MKSPLLTATADTATVLLAHRELYHEVLARWRRCDAEGAVLCAELRRADGGSERRAASLARVLRSRLGCVLQRSLQSWAVNAALVARAHSARREAGARKELQLALEAAGEELGALRNQLARERQQRQLREQEEVAVLRAAGLGPSDAGAVHALGDAYAAAAGPCCTHVAPSTDANNQRASGVAEAMGGSGNGGDCGSYGDSCCTSSRDSIRQSFVPASCSHASQLRASLPPPPPVATAPALGHHAQALLAAWHTAAR